MTLMTVLLTIEDLLSVVHELVIRADTQDVDQHLRHCRTHRQRHTNM